MSSLTLGFDQGYINVEKPNIKRIRRSALLVISVYEASFDEYFQNKLV